MKYERKMVEMGLCKGRHEMPVDDYIFDSIADPMDFGTMEVEAMGKLAKYQGRTLVLYVTGLTSCLIAVLNACRRVHIKVDLMHFDCTTGEYKLQVVR